MKDVPGAGAAGGMGAALMAFLGAELKSGIEIVTTALNLEEHIHDCTLVITGEGRIDSQSIHGKVPIGVANVAKKYHKPVIGIAGSLTDDVGVVHQHGIDAVFSVLTSIGTLDEAFRGAYDNICRASRNIAATLAIECATRVTRARKPSILRAEADQTVAASSSSSSGRRAEGGKSGLHRAGCRNARGNPRPVQQRANCRWPAQAGSGKGERVR